MSNYQTITQSICYLDSMGNDREEEVGMEFSPNGLTGKGTFILYECPSDAEEEVINEYQANWAIEYRFEDFSNQIDNWTEFQSFVNEIKSTLVGQMCEALNFLQGNDYSSSVNYAQDLPLLHHYNIWKGQQALFNAVPPVPKSSQPTFLTLRRITMSSKIDNFSTIDYHISARESELKRLKQQLASARFLLADYKMEFFEWSFANNEMTNGEYTPSLVKDSVKIPLVNFGGAKFYLATCQTTVEILELRGLPFIAKSDYLELEKMELSTLKHLALFVNQSPENRDNFHKSFDQHGMFEFTESNYYEDFKDFEETLLEREKLHKEIKKSLITKKPTMKI